MPRVKMYDPPGQKQLEEEFRERYGGMMTMKDVGTEIGVTHYNSIHKFLAGVPSVKFGQRKRWQVSAIAKAIWDARGSEDEDNYEQE